MNRATAVVRSRLGRAILVLVVIAVVVIVALVVIPKDHGHRGGTPSAEGGTTLSPGPGATSAPGTTKGPGGKKVGGGRRTTSTAPPATGSDDKLHVAPHLPVLAPCELSPHTCGYPDATNTGVPAGTALTPSGSIVVSTNGAVIDGMNVTGSITVAANDVTIENSRVTCAGSCSAAFVIWVRKNTTGLVVEDVEATGSATVGADVGGGGPATVLRCNLHGALDGFHAISGSVIRDSYIHDLTPTSTSHDDAIQQIPAQANGVTIVHNTLIPYNLALNIYNNSAYICGNQCTGTTNMTFTDNLLDGGSHTLQCPFRGTSGNVFARNEFGRNSRFGPITAMCLNTTGDRFDQATNVFVGTTTPVS